MDKIKYLAVAAVFLCPLIFGKQAMPAPNEHLNWGSEVNPGQCDETSGNLVININHKVTNDVDSAVGGGVWATDNYKRNIQVRQIGENTFCAVLHYTGSFVTDDGQSPGNTDTIAAGIKGTFEGGYRATIVGTLNPNPQHRTRGYIGTFDYGCNVETDTGGHETCTSLFSWLNTYFNTVDSFEYNWWGWVYNGGNNGTWVNSSDGNQGDITD